MQSKTLPTPSSTQKGNEGNFGEGKVHRWKWRIFEAAYLKLLLMLGVNISNGKLRSSMGTAEEQKVQNAGAFIC